DDGAGDRGVQNRYASRRRDRSRVGEVASESAHARDDDAVAVCRDSAAIAEDTDEGRHIDKLDAGSVRQDRAAVHNAVPGCAVAEKSPGINPNAVERPSRNKAGVGDGAREGLKRLAYKNATSTRTDRAPVGNATEKVRKVGRSNAGGFAADHPADSV